MSCRFSSFLAEKQPHAPPFLTRAFTLRDVVFRNSHRLFFPVSSSRPNKHTHSYSNSFVRSFTHEPPRQRTTASSFFVFGDEYQAAVATADRSVAKREKEEKERKEEVPTPPSSTAAVAPAHLSEEAAFAALEAFSPIAQAPAAALEAMVAFEASQKATGGRRCSTWSTRRRKGKGTRTTRTSFGEHFPEAKPNYIAFVWPFVCLGLSLAPP